MKNIRKTVNIDKLFEFKIEPPFQNPKYKIDSIRCETLFLQN